MITVTKGQILASEKGLNILANTKLPIVIGYRIGKLIKQVSDELKEIEGIRQEIIQKYGNKDAEGNIIVNQTNNTIQITAEHIEEFNAEFTLLLDEVCELRGELIDASVLNDIKMTAQEINSIEPFLKIE